MELISSCGVRSVKIGYSAEEFQNKYRKLKSVLTGFVIPIVMN